ncbi:MAG: hypothetical protein AAGE94_04845, partial [Acidobacteriota bacterium]
VAALAAIVVDRRSRKLQTEGSAAWWLTTLAFGGLGALFLLGGLALLSPWVDVPASLRIHARVLGVFVAVWGLLLVTAKWWMRERPAFAPALLLYGFAWLYGMASLWVLPAADAVKSARGFAEQIDRRVTAPGKPIASYRFWDWRAGYVYYTDRSIPNMKQPAQLLAFWRRNDEAHVLVEAPHAEEVERLLPLAELVHRARIGGREAFLFRKPHTVASRGAVLSRARVAEADRLRPVDRAGPHRVPGNTVGGAP